MRALRSEGCGDSLTSVQATNTASKSYPVEGIMGAVCPHGVPGVGLFYVLTTKENFSYYLALLLALRQSRPDIIMACFDTACKCVDAMFSSSFFSPHLTCRLEPTWLRMSPQGPQLVVDQLHAKGHQQRCQLAFSAQHRQRMGWRNAGQSCEQAWASILDVCDVVRSMTQANHKQTINAALIQLAAGRQRSIAVTLRRMYRTWVALGARSNMVDIGFATASITQAMCCKGGATIWSSSCSCLCALGRRPVVASRAPPAVGRSTAGRMGWTPPGAHIGLTFTSSRSSIALSMAIAWTWTTRYLCIIYNVMPCTCVKLYPQMLFVKLKDLQQREGPLRGTKQKELQAVVQRLSDQGTCTSPSTFYQCHHPCLRDQ